MSGVLRRAGFPGIGPTAHYTGYVGARNGLSHPELDPGQGLAIVTEGLLGYLSTDAVEGLWRRFARTLDGFAAGRYISDLHLGGVLTTQVRLFRVLLSALVRGRVYLHFTDATEAEEALVTAGFRDARVCPAVEVGSDDRERGSRLANILEASITLPSEASTA
jgi:O-methyltransferase involved in polyketide biosynthesis